MHCGRIEREHIGNTPYTRVVQLPIRINTAKTDETLVFQLPALHL